MDYDLVNLSTPDVMLIWNSINYSSLAAFKSATGKRRTGCKATRVSPTPQAAISTSPRVTSDRLGELRRERSDEH
jgi:hypothetical protein